MKLLGLTGGIGMGKSTAAELLARRGLPVIDTDIVARQVVEPGEPALAEIRQAFGQEVIAADGTLDRGQLARRAFADGPARRQLEAILHPRIRAVWQTQAEVWRAEGRRCVVVVIPLLFETNAEDQFTATICVACSAATQRQRLASRGWTDEEIDQRTRAQMPIERKMALSDYVIWTEGSMEAHAEQWDRILQTIQS